MEKIYKAFPYFPFYGIRKTKAYYFAIQFYLLINLLSLPFQSNAQIFTENFNTLTDGTAITTSNTNFNYVRVGSGGGSIEADDDCGISGMAMNIGGTTSTSLNGVGRSALTSSDVTTMSFTVCSADWSAGDLFIGMGTGTTFTGNGTFATNDLLWGLQLNNGALEFRTLVPSQWNAVTPAPTFTNNTCYDFHIVANGSASAITDYNGSEDLAAGRMDIYIDETLIANDIFIVDNQSSTAFRIYQVSGGARYCVDDIAIYNAAQALPCSITAISVTPISVCDGQNTHSSNDDVYLANVTVNFSNAPGSGNLVLSGDGSASVAVGSLSSSTSHTFIAVTLPADGGAIALTATFSADNACTFTNNNAGTAPSSCSPTCSDGIQNGTETGIDCGGPCTPCATMTNVYEEDFEGIHNWTLNVSTGTNGADPNFWVVSDAEGGVTPPGCGVGSNGDKTLHITSVFNPTGGAAYDAGGLCGILFCPQTNARAESPSFATTGHSGLILEFDYIANGDGLTDNASIWYNTGSGWTLLVTSLKSSTCMLGQGQWAHYTIALPASFDNNPSVKIGFNWTNNDDGIGTDPSVAINNIVIKEGAAFCDISSIDFSDQQPCDDNGTMDQTDDFYTADITINFMNPPATGFLELEQDGAVIDIVNIAVGSLVGNSHTFQDVRLKANGMVNAVEAQFSADQQNCVRTTPAPAVNSCSPVCSISSIMFSDQQGCDNNDTQDPNDDFYTADITINFMNPPAAGFLELEQDGAVLDVVNIPVGSLVGNSHTFQDVRLKANGMVNAVEAQFSADQQNCVRTTPAPAVNNCPCNIDLNGATIDGNPQTATVCRDESFALTLDGATSTGLVNGNTINWYYSSNPAFIPGMEGTLLGSSMVTDAGMASGPKNSCADIAAGEIALVSVQSDNPDVFAFVTLVDLAAGVQINFTDAGWTGSGFHSAEHGFITWTAPMGGTTAGTTITITINGDPDTPANVIASSGTVTYSETGGSNDFALSADGDQVLAFCGTAASPSSFLAGVHTYGNIWDASFEGADLAQKSLLPPGLIVGQSAVAIGAGAPGSEVDNGRFNCNGGSLAGTTSEIAANINTASNWTTSNDMIVPTVASCDYEIESPSDLNISTLQTSIDACGTFYIKGILNPLPTSCSADETATAALQVEVLCPEAVLSGDVVICQGQSASVTLTISGAPVSQNVSGNITNGTVDINFTGITDGDGNAVILINGLTQAGTYQIENILIGAACPNIETSGNASVTVEQPPVVTIANQEPVVCSIRRLSLASLQASITLDGQPFTGVWDVIEADSDGTFRDAGDAINTTFSTAVSFAPGATDIARGYVTLILRSDDPDGPCTEVEASVRLTILRVNCGEFPWNGQ